MPIDPPDLTTAPAPELTPATPEEAPAPAPVLPVRRRVEDWAGRKGTPRWAFLAAAAGHRWEHGPQVSGTELAEAEFDEAIRKTTSDRS